MSTTFIRDRLVERRVDRRAYLKAVSYVREDGRARAGAHDRSE